MDEIKTVEQAIIFLYGVQMMPILLKEKKTHEYIKQCKDILKDIDFATPMFDKLEKENVI